MFLFSRILLYLFMFFLIILLTSWEPEKKPLKLWKAFLKVPMIPGASQYFQTEDIKDIVTTIFIPLKIDYIKFASNMTFLSCEGDSEKLISDKETYYNYINNYSKQLTPSIKKFTRFIDRPLFIPIWVIAAFPDVIDWITSNDDGSFLVERHSLCFSKEDKMNENQFPCVQEWDTKTEAKYYKKMVENYLEMVNPSLETQ